MKRKEAIEKSQNNDDVSEQCAAGAECNINGTIERGTRWIQCEECESWFHDYCIGYEEASEEELDKLNFICADCDDDVDE